MILSVSRRTDIPAFYSEWFINRIKAGFVDVRNPMNIHQVSRVNIKPEVVDCIVFWTKNANKIISKLGEINNYNYYFQYSINPYDKQIEVNVPTKKNIIENFKNLADEIGFNRVIWRYDPIVLTNTIDVNYHLCYFEKLAKRLSGYTKRCVISFVDLYKKTITNTKDLTIREPRLEEIHLLAKGLSMIASDYGIEIFSCSEEIDLEENGIKHGSCIDRTLIEEIVGYELNVKKDKNQRNLCKCIESIDLGAYNTCLHGCRYCYANFNDSKVKLQNQKHNPLSSLLVGELEDTDIIKERSVKILKNNSLFL